MQIGCLVAVRDAARLSGDLLVVASVPSLENNTAAVFELEATRGPSTLIDIKRRALLSCGVVHLWY